MHYIGRYVLFLSPLLNQNIINILLITPVFLAELEGSNFRPLHGAGRLAQQEEGDGHLVGGDVVHLSQCTCFNPNFSS